METNTSKPWATSSFSNIQLDLATEALLNKHHKCHSLGKIETIDFLYWGEVWYIKNQKFVDWDQNKNALARPKADHFQWAKILFTLSRDQKRRNPSEWNCWSEYLLAKHKKRLLCEKEKCQTKDNRFLPSHISQTFFPKAFWSSLACLVLDP